MKAGGLNFAFTRDSLNQLLGIDEYTTVIFGADANHPPVGSFQGVPSIAAVVASSDSAFQNFPASMHLQAGGQ